MDENKVMLQIKDLTKVFDDGKGNAVQAVNHVSFDVYDNEFLVLLGPGQCGKTVLLNMIAGLLDPDEGEILREKVHDLKQLVRAYQLGWIKETRCDDSVW